MPLQPVPGGSRGGAEGRAAAGPPRRLDRKQVLFREGETAAAMYLVESGRLKLTQLAADGQEVLVRFVVPGEICAGVTALEGSAYPVTAQAVEPAGLLVWPRDVLRELCRVYPRSRPTSCAPSPATCRIR